MATEENNTSHRLGTRGDIQLSKGNEIGVGCKGLEQLGEKDGNPTEYISMVDNIIDTQINIEKFGKVIQAGLQNTKEMAAKWNWRSDTDEFNWRDNPCSLRISYDKKNQILQVQVWNELIQIWTRLSLTKEEILKILEG